jgi:hypothetical protein
LHCYLLTRIISGSELRSPAPCNQLVSDRRSPPRSAQDNTQALAAAYKVQMRDLTEFLSLFLFYSTIDWFIAHLADHVPCGWMTTTFLIVRFVHSRLVLWDKHHQARPVAERKSQIHPNGSIQRTKTHSPSCT